MRNFYNFINESNDTISETVICVLRELKRIKCDILIRQKNIMFKREIDELHIIKMNYDETSDDVWCYYYTIDEDIVTITNFNSISKETKEQIYNYLKENYTEYEYLFSGKDMGLL